MTCAHKGKLQRPPDTCVVYVATQRRSCGVVEDSAAKELCDDIEAVRAVLELREELVLRPTSCQIRSCQAKHIRNCVRLYSHNPSQRRFLYLPGFMCDLALFQQRLPATLVHSAWEQLVQKSCAKSVE